MFKVGPFWLDSSGGTKNFRVGQISPENMVWGTIFSSRNFGGLLRRTGCQLCTSYYFKNFKYTVDFELGNQ